MLKVVHNQWGEVWSSVVIFSLGYFCLRCAKIAYAVVNFDYDDTDFTPRREKWDFGNANTMEI